MHTFKNDLHKFALVFCKQGPIIFLYKGLKKHFNSNSFHGFISEPDWKIIQFFFFSLDAKKELMKTLLAD